MEIEDGKAEETPVPMQGGGEDEFESAIEDLVSPVEERETPSLARKELPRKKEDEVAELKEIIENLTEELKKREDDMISARDQSLRAMAEAENYKKRLAREKEEFEKYAAVPAVKGLLPALDNLENAIKAGREGADAAKLLEGVELIDRKSVV